MAFLCPLLLRLLEWILTKWRKSLPIIPDFKVSWFFNQLTLFNIRAVLDVYKLNRTREHNYLEKKSYIILRSSL